ncbi:MAG: DUF192 domain-containing protein [Nitriliruptoraceae bacterium]
MRRATRPGRSILAPGPVVLAFALVLAGCTTDGAPGPDAAEPPPAATGTPADAHAPEVPPLHPAIDDLPEAVVTLVDGDTRLEVDVKVAADDPSRRRGLMEVAELPDGVGMLFVFEAERRGGFWMWNTVIPLDIAFVGVDGSVHTIATMVPCEEDEPSACPVTGPEQPYRSALEVPEGWFDRVGVSAGAELSWSDPVPPTS